LQYWSALTLNGISFGMILFLVASGLTLTLGTMRLLNLTHGSFFMLGAYVAYRLGEQGHGLVTAWLGATIVAAVCGAAVYLLLRRTGHDELRQVLLTFGLLFAIADLALVYFGGLPVIVDRPSSLQGTWNLGFVDYPSYRLVLILVGLMVAVALWYFQFRTRAGAMLRAVVDDREMAEGVGINPRVLAAGTFIVGAALAGISGALGGAVVGAYPGVDVEILLFALVIVIVGGAGSVGGALIGSLLIGLINSLTVALIPSLALFSMFIAMLIVLAVRPNGIAGRSLA
jgi:branched-chain amino acid transport system permease protein